MTTETLPLIVETAPATRSRRPRGQYPKKAARATELVEKKLPEYIEAHDVNALFRVAPICGWQTEDESGRYGRRVAAI